jgi:small-conductance mechanosensitive channel
MAAESAKMRSSFQAQISMLDTQVQELQDALASARASRPLRAPTSSHTTPQKQSNSVDVLTERVKQLETANMALESVLLGAQNKGLHSLGVTQDESDIACLLQEARTALAERDAQLGRLRLELELMQAQHGSVV